MLVWRGYCDLVGGCGWGMRAEVGGSMVGRDEAERVVVWEMVW